MLNRVMPQRSALKTAALLLGLILSAACGNQSTPPPATSAPMEAPAPAAANATTTTVAHDAATTHTLRTTDTVPVAIKGVAPWLAGAGDKLNVYMYSEYIDPDMLAKFKAQTGIAVNLSVYETTEDMMAKMQQAGGDSAYDVVVASDHIIPVMAKLKLIQPIKANEIGNAHNVMPRFADPAYDHNSQYSLPYQWGTMGLIVDKKQVPKYDETWGLLFDAAKQPGNFLLIDSMRDMFAAALKYQGKNINTRAAADLKAAADLIQQAKATKKCLGFEGGAGGKNKVADGTAAVAIAYNGDAVKAVQEDKEGHLAYFVPKEGTLIWVDAMVIPSHAPNPVGARAFINFILDGAEGAQLSNFNKYATPNTASLPLIDKTDRANEGIYPSDAAMAKMDFLEDVGDASRLYDETWTAIKAK